MSDYNDIMDEFKYFIQGDHEGPMVGFIIDSPWIPGYREVDTLDFYFNDTIWIDAYTQIYQELKGSVFIPGLWVEYGMAAEPSGWGTKIQWYHDSPPSIRQIIGGVDTIINAEIPNPERDGLMPLILRQSERVFPVMKEKSCNARIAACRGPLAIASHLLGVTELLMATQIEKDATLQVIDRMTDLCIAWLHAQIQRIESPLGILVLDDVVGMMGPQDAELFALPYLKKIFDAFPSLVHIYHNDTPNEKIIPGYKGLTIDVLNFSHKTDIPTARNLVGEGMILMGNIPPLDVLVRGSTDEVATYTNNLIELNHDYGPILISAGGGVSPGCPIENLKTVIQIIQDS